MGLRLSTLGTSATNWSVVPTANDRRWVWSSRWNENWQGKPKYREKPIPVPLCPPQMLCHLTWDRILGRGGGKRTTARLSCGTACLWSWMHVSFLLKRIGVFSSHNTKPKFRSSLTDKHLSDCMRVPVTKYTPEHNNLAEMLGQASRWIPYLCSDGPFS
jgi:hypothetical protein